MKIGLSTPLFQTVSNRADIRKAIYSEGPKNSFLHLPQHNAFVVPRPADIYPIIIGERMKGNLSGNGFTVVRFCYEYFDSKFMGTAVKVPPQNSQIEDHLNYSRSLNEKSWPSALADQGMSTLVDVVLDAYRFRQLPHKESHDVKYRTGGFVTLEPESSNRSLKQVEIHKADIANLSSVLRGLPSENIVYLINRSFFLEDGVLPNHTNKRAVNDFKNTMQPILEQKPLTVLATASNSKYFADSFFMLDEIFDSSF